MASKVTRTAVIAVSALGASGLVAASAQAAAPTIPTALVNQPAVAGASSVTPESAVVHGVIDTGGNPGSAFVLPPGQELYWSNSFLLNNSTGTAGVTEHVDGLPADGSSDSYPTSSTSTVLNNAGENNYSTVLFEYDPASDYAANGNNPGPETGYATEFNKSTEGGLASVSATIGGYPAANATGISGALTPGTKYDYWIVQQAGATDDGETVNTFNGSATGTNPTYSCYPDSYAAAVAPYNSYSTSGTIAGGLNSSGTAQTTPQPQIQGPCVYYYGGGSNYYSSAPGTFTTPALGSVVVGNGLATGTKKTVTTKATVTTNGVKSTKVTKTTTLTNIKATVVANNSSPEGAKGTIELDYAGKSIGTAKFTVAAKASKNLALSLTSYGKTLLSKGTKISAKLIYTTTTDQPTTTKSVTL